MELAEDLVASGFTGTATLKVAVLRRDTLLDEAEPLIRGMLSELGVGLPSRGDRDGEYGMLLRTFGYWGLPFSDFFSEFVDSVPALDKQDHLDQTLNHLLDEWDAAETKELQGEVIERMRAEIRAHVRSN